MSTTTSTHVVAPWGYDLLPSQKDVRAQWKFQIFGSIVLCVFLYLVDATQDTNIFCSEADIIGSKSFILACIF